MINLKRNRRKPVIPSSSMSDVGFLLLIFIMLISLMNQRHEEPIEYSEAARIEKTQEKDNLEIWIQKIVFTCKIFSLSSKKKWD